MKRKLAYEFKIHSSYVIQAFYFLMSKKKKQKFNEPM